MITYTIKSTKLGRPVTFSCPRAGGYVYVDLNGREGTLGKQICKGGSLGGETLRHVYKGTCETENAAVFRMACRAWWRAYLRKLGRYNQGVYFSDAM